MTKTRILIKAVSVSGLALLNCKGTTNANRSLRIRAMIAYAATLTDKQFDRIIKRQILAEKKGKTK